MSWTRTSWIGTDALPNGMSHLALPILREDKRGQLMVFATARDALSRSHPVCADAELDQDGRLTLQCSWRVIAGPGEPGYFDENGLSLSDVRPTPDGFEGVTFGWRLRAGGGWFNEIGHLQMDFRGALLKRSIAPWQPRTALDPVSMAYPTFGRNDDLLYCAPTGLRHDTGTPADFRIMRMDLKSGHREVVADPTMLNMPGIFAFTRPWLGGPFSDERLFVSVRGDKYQIMSINYMNISQPGEMGAMREELQGQRNERESGSACYPSLFEGQGLSLMLYNGRGYGASGFGVVARDRDDSNK